MWSTQGDFILVRCPVNLPVKHISSSQISVYYGRRALAGEFRNWHFSCNINSVDKCLPVEPMSLFLKIVRRLPFLSCSVSAVSCTIANVIHFSKFVQCLVVALPPHRWTGIRRALTWVAGKLTPASLIVERTGYELVDMSVLTKLSVCAQRGVGWFNGCYPN